MADRPNVPATFERTVCACADCIQPCKEQPGPLAPGDLERIASFLGKPTRDVLGKFWASPGAVILGVLTGQRKRVGSITPKMKDGRCVFLTDDDRCGIHEVAPFGCAYADTHQSEEQWQPRSKWLYTTIERDEQYQSWRRMLPAATSYRPRIANVPLSGLPRVESLRERVNADSRVGGHDDAAKQKAEEAEESKHE